ncbi:hypothetical protein [Psychroserpens damuponensis]|uniref:hypothetical protein n=1 Tax=Psychroserpens damuponensis TaxID=943936 RepID=UPI000A78D19B|nr:hypothetical protein [Psychroserpens damuponensis]
MIKNLLPILLIIACLVMIVVNVITTDDYDNGFWMQTLSSVLLIFAMIATLYSRHKSKK